ncbi:c-type cytochrome [Pelagibaculum spongiae]|uniref:Cytochrome c4 n=1 Tax=Pelagibaculum spongiae TaxID=2080658 RepID=A0A2V1H4F3_9GAMM|nr:c-type cytochrome [Pelagibaculum spongiae]PVZ70516.1 cytochrome c4 [Pelagibaculum spongiae]
MKKLILALMIVGAGPAMAGGDADAGATKAATCAACHGPDGNSLVPSFPKIAGQHEKYLYKQLTQFKMHEGQTEPMRNNATMMPMVTPLNDQDLQDLAAYFSKQTAKPGSAKPENLKLGEKIWRAGIPAKGVAACQACHLADGSGIASAGYPALSGQHADYTTAQLNAFRSGERYNDPNKMMRSVAAKLSDAEIQAVANFVQGLH